MISELGVGAASMKSSCGAGTSSSRPSSLALRRSPKDDIVNVKKKEKKKEKGLEREVEDKLSVRTIGSLRKTTLLCLLSSLMIKRRLVV